MGAKSEHDREVKEASKKGAKKAKAEVKEGGKPTKADEARLKLKQVGSILCVDLLLHASLAFQSLTGIAGFRDVCCCRR